MTILWQDGFDLYNNLGDLALNYQTQNNGTFSITGGRFGGGAYTTRRGYQGISKTIGTETNIWVSMAMQTVETDTTDYTVLTWGSTASVSGGVEGMLTYNTSTGVWKLYRGDLVALLEAWTAPLSSGWHWIDARYFINSTTGTFELWIDNVQVATFTGLNTQQNSGQSIVYVGISDSYGGNSQIFTVDDLFIYDTGTSRLGDSRIETVMPNSDASPNQGTPSTGTSHYSVVNEGQWNTTNYITMPNTSGDKEVFGISAIASTPATVWNVKVMLVSEKSDAGSFQLEPLVISSGTESDGSAQQLTTSWGTQSSMFSTDPHTSAAWLYSAVNAMDIGFKVP